MTPPSWNSPAPRGPPGAAAAGSPARTGTPANASIPATASTPGNNSPTVRRTRNFLANQGAARKPGAGKPTTGKLWYGKYRKALAWKGHLVPGLGQGPRGQVACPRPGPSPGAKAGAKPRYQSPGTKRAFDAEGHRWPALGTGWPRC